MAKEELRGDNSYGLEIEFAGEVNEEDVGSATEILADDQWGPTIVERGRGRWFAWRQAAVERLRHRLRAARRLLTWRTAAWVAGAALLGFGIGAVTEPSAKQVAAHYVSTDFNLHLDNEPITASGQAQMAQLTGAAWSVSPVTTLVVHVINDDTMTLRLHNGTLSGTRISNGTLVPDGTGVLAPGQRGTLTAQVTVSCANSPADATAYAADPRPLTAVIPVSAQSRPSSVVQLVSGSPQDDLYIASQLCAGLPSPLTLSFQPVFSTVAQNGPVVQITVHNVTNQTIRYASELSTQNVNTTDMQTIAAHATAELDIPLAPLCSTPGQLLVSPSVGLFMSTLSGSYQTSHEVTIDSDRRLAEACYG